MDVHIRNGVGDGQLNEGCGAEFVHKNGKAPQNFQDKEDRCGGRTAGATEGFCEIWEVPLESM